MTVDEAAKELEVSPALVYRLCAERQIGYTRVGFGRGRITISRDQVDEYRRGREVLPLPGPGPGTDRRPRRPGAAPAVRDRVAEYKRKRGVR